MFSQRLGNLHFWLWQVGILTKVMMMYYLGFVYFPRWVVDYLPLQQWAVPQLILTGGAYLIGIGFIFFVFNLMWSSTRGRTVQGDPWPVVLQESGQSAPATPTPAE